MKSTSLTPELEESRKKIKKIAESVGLDFFETIFMLSLSANNIFI